MSTNKIGFYKEKKEKYCRSIIKYAPYELLRWFIFKVYPNQENI